MCPAAEAVHATDRDNFGAMTTQAIPIVAALDFGTVRTGVAVTDELGLLAHPRPALDSRDTRALLNAISRFAEAERVERFILGLPLHLDGTEGRSARRVRQFAAELNKRTGIAVEFCDERLSTVEARSRLRASGHSDRQARSKIDSSAAAILLQSWVDAHDVSTTRLF